MHVCALMLLDEYVRNTLVACYVAIKRMSLVPCERAHHLPLPEQRWGRRECCVQRFLGDRETDVSPDPGSAVCPSPAAWLQPAPPSRTPPQRNPALDFPHPEPAATHTHTQCLEINKSCQRRVIVVHHYNPIFSQFLRGMIILWNQKVNNFIHFH